jgi:hypothetical protein
VGEASILATFRAAPDNNPGSGGIVEMISTTKSGEPDEWSPGTTQCPALTLLDGCSILVP